MGRHRPVDFVGWRLYRRSFVAPVLALLVLLATSFRADAPVQGALPPTLVNDRAEQLLDRSQEFTALFPDRRPGTEGANDSAQWMANAFAELKLTTRKSIATTTDPASGDSVPLVNVEAVLSGRTPELVVILAHRDTADVRGRGSDAVGQIALLTLAKELAATQDRRRTYLFVSTDGATLNGGGARALANRLRTRGKVVAVIGLDRIGGGDQLRADVAPSGRHAAPLGLALAAQSAVAAEGGAAGGAGIATQLLHLAVPLTLREHGQLLSVGLPAVTVTAGDDQLRVNGDAEPTAAAVGAGLRATQRMLTTLDGVDQLQSAGKTWVAAQQRVYRGWALKILIASLLVPVWVTAVDMLVRHRRGWNLPAAVATGARAMLAGITSVAALWLLGAVGALPGSIDHPPNPGHLSDVRVIAVAIWLLVTVGVWLLARGPDWRRQRRPAARVHAGADTPEVVTTFIGLVAISALALAVNPFAVLLVVPALHVWMGMASWQVVFYRARVLGVWAGGAVLPLVALLAVGARGDTGLGTPWYALQLVQTRTVPPALALLIAAGAGLAVLLVIAATGRVASPALPRIRSTIDSARDRDVLTISVIPQLTRTLTRGARARAKALRAPQRHRRAPSRPRARQDLVQPPVDDAQARRELRERARREQRSRVRSR